MRAQMSSSCCVAQTLDTSQHYRGKKKRLIQVCVNTSELWASRVIKEQTDGRQTKVMSIDTDCDLQIPNAAASLWDMLKDSQLLGRQCGSPRLLPPTSAGGIHNWQWTLLRTSHASWECQRPSHHHGGARKTKEVLSSNANINSSTLIIWFTKHTEKYQHVTCLTFKHTLEVVVMSSRSLANIEMKHLWSQIIGMLGWMDVLPGWNRHWSPHSSCG